MAFARRARSRAAAAVAITHLPSGGFCHRLPHIRILAVSMWALIFLSAPMMIAYGQVQQVTPLFYVQVALLYVPFVILPALLGSWMILFLVRILSQPIV